MENTEKNNPEINEQAFNITGNSAQGATPDWRDILERDTQGHRPQNERRNLQADQERRSGDGAGANDPGRRDDRQDNG